MKRAVVPVVATTAVLALVGGCAEEEVECVDQPAPGQIAGERMPVEIQPSDQFPGPTPEEVEAAMPEIGNRPSVTEQALYELRQETLTMSGEIGATSRGRCDSDVVGSVGSTTLCTIPYEGVDVRWQVRITGVGPGVVGDVSYEYETELKKGVLTDTKVYEQLAWDTKRGYDPKPARCEDLPALFTAEPGEDTGHRCQRVDYSCTDGVEEFAWRDMPVTVDEKGFIEFGRD